VEVRRRVEGLSLVRLADGQQEIPAWEDRARGRVLTLLSVCAAVLFICAILYTRLCPCFTS
ncbi:MAG: hypothetical protein SGPRY_002469, partial [Prymnesium sp.]